MIANFNLKTELMAKNNNLMTRLKLKINPLQPGVAYLYPLKISEENL